MNDATLELIDTPVTDIVERMREARSDYHNPLMREAADEIERLREEINSVRGLLLKAADEINLLRGLSL